MPGSLPEPASGNGGGGGPPVSCAASGPGTGRPESFPTAGIDASLVTGDTGRDASGVAPLFVDGEPPPDGPERRSVSTAPPHAATPAVHANANAGEKRARNLGEAMRLCVM
jgi:hypothetical protein